MAKLDEVEGGREWLPEAKRNGLTYQQYYNRIFVLDYPPEAAATVPLSTQFGRPVNTRSMRQRCLSAGVEPSRFHLLRKRHPELSKDELLEFMKEQKNG